MIFGRRIGESLEASFPICRDRGRMGGRVQGFGVRVCLSFVAI